MNLMSKPYEYLDYNFPKDLEKKFKGFSFSRNKIGCSKADIFYLQDKQGNGYYLKTMIPEIGRDLISEKQMLLFLKDKLPVPKLEYYSKYQGREFLVTTEIKGDVSYHAKTVKAIERNIRILAYGLNLLHSVETHDCKIHKTIDYLFKIAEQRLEAGLVKGKYFDKRWSDKKPENLLKHIKLNKPETVEMTFTHGDYCLPNIIIQNGKLNGFIDLAYAGLNDRYFDLAAVCWSIEYNFGKRWINPFLKEYGISEIDWNKIKFYQMLNEFL